MSKRNQHPVNPESQPPQQRPGSLVAQQTSIQFTGILPPPQILEEYERILPGTTERFLALAERQAAHRMYLEKRLVESEIARANWGLVAGFLVTMAFGGISGWLINGGHQWAGGVLGTVDLVSL